MARTTCLIEFDNNPQKVFYGGQLLSGQVSLTLHKEKTVRGATVCMMTLTLNGVCVRMLLNVIS